MVLRAGLYTWRGEGGVMMRMHVLVGVRRHWALLNSGDQLRHFQGSCQTTRQRIPTFTTGMLPSSTTAMVHPLRAMCEWIEGIIIQVKVITESLYCHKLNCSANPVDWKGTTIYFRCTHACPVRLHMNMIQYILSTYQRTEGLGSQHGRFTSCWHELSQRGHSHWMLR